MKYLLKWQKVAAKNYGQINGKQFLPVVTENFNSGAYFVQINVYKITYYLKKNIYLLNDSTLINTGYDINSPVPMVMDYHGWGGDANFQERDCQDCSSICWSVTTLVKIVGEFVSDELDICVTR